MLDRIGQGGTAEVYRARHPAGPAAVKLIRAVGTHEAARVALYREVRAMAALSHPGVVRLFDYGRIEQRIYGFEPGTPYLAMELGQGVVGFPVDWASLRASLLEILDALAHAHARGVIHLDLKQENVLSFGPGRHKLADFGIAWGLASKQAKPGRVVGSPPYM